MNKNIASYINKQGFKTLITDKYLGKDCFDSFDNIVSLSNSKSVISASLGFNMFNIKTIAYIDNFFEFIYVYDSCFREFSINILVCMDKSMLPKHLNIGILNDYKIKNCNVRNKVSSSLEELVANVKKNKDTGFFVLGDL